MTITYSLEFLRRVSRRRHSTRHGIDSIAEFVEEFAARLTSDYLDKLQTELPILKVQFTLITAPQFPTCRNN